MSTIAGETIKVTRVSEGIAWEADDELAAEEPLQIQMQYGSSNNRVQKNIAVTMRTPGNDGELATGFLFTEGIINSKDQVDSILQSSNSADTITIVLKENIEPGKDTSDRNFYTTSACGVCGKSSIDAIATHSIFKNEKDNSKVSASLLYELPAQLRRQQALFENTGGLHAAALLNTDGSFITLREDVGRHNALDKLIGVSLLKDQLPLTGCILLLSGRTSFELIQKAMMAGIKFIAAIGAPSSLAVELAKQNDITLIGFLKSDRFNIYSGEKRVLV